jgi:hypothetical protein
MISRFATLLPLLLALTGCDPFQRAGVWQPNHANETNLRAMVDAPSDLAAAAPASHADGGMAAAAVARLRHDQVRPLLDSGLARIVPVNGGAAVAPAAVPAGGPAP